MFVEDPVRKEALGDIYRANLAGVDRPPTNGDESKSSLQRERMDTSGAHLAAHIQDAPVLLIPCMQGRIDHGTSAMSATFWASVMPRCGASAWLFAPAGWAPAGPRFTCSEGANARRPKCSAFPTTSTARSGSFRSLTPRAWTSSRLDDLRPRTCRAGTPGRSIRRLRHTRPRAASRQRIWLGSILRFEFDVELGEVFGEDGLECGH
jgi:hypothetical protein